MPLLLDTHVLLWYALGNTKLSLSGRKQIAAASDCYVSLAALWEVAIKRALGRGLPEGVNVETFRALIAEADFQLLNITVPHIQTTERLPLLHGDPFDRLMVAQAATEGMQLLTADTALAAYGDHILLV